MGDLINDIGRWKLNGAPILIQVAELVNVSKFCCRQVMFGCTINFLSGFLLLSKQISSSEILRTNTFNYAEEVDEFSWSFQILATPSRHDDEISSRQKHIAVALQQPQGVTKKCQELPGLKVKRGVYLHTNTAWCTTARLGIRLEIAQLL
jgi:hypothetical protein